MTHNIRKRLFLCKNVPSVIYLVIIYSIFKSVQKLNNTWVLQLVKESSFSLLSEAMYFLVPYIAVFVVGMLVGGNFEKENMIERERERAIIVRDLKARNKKYESKREEEEYEKSRKQVCVINL